MRYQIEEKNKLPLTFKFVDEYRGEKINPKSTDVIYGTCSRYKTDFLMLVKPCKPISRLL
ncbi:hypothetical protein SAMN04488023_12529 [Pedobacter rhizosphaerae]|uniref:Uncharacterized protein n=1 Tax=Pedobacter rhizosphaerae TaxID=390241 RepID=A0A1H9TY19_9SPHI|nr:hypothetical protein SAMN04488023_12529 [Pedobacter rhizosphaerae]